MAHWMRALAGVTMLLTGPSAALAAPAADASVVQRTSARAIPFISATVKGSSGTEFRLTWSAPDAGVVKIYAGTNPQHIGRDYLVGNGSAAGSTLVRGLPAAPRWYFELVPRVGAPLTIAEREIDLPTAPNFRDIGGYRTTDGRWVRMGMLYRSGELDKLDAVDLAKVSALGINLVADLRRPSERAKQPDRLPKSARTISLNVMGEEALDMASVLRTVAAGQGAAYLVEANQEMVKRQSAREAYARLLGAITNDNEGATLYHCAGGKDRTGWATAVILTLLGVPRETVIADYLASNEALARKNEFIFAKFAKGSPAISRDLLEPTLTVRRSYIEAAFEEATSRYGSFEAYVRDGLGLSSASIADLQSQFLAGQPQ